MKKIGILITIFLFMNSCNETSKKSSLNKSKITEIDFWNGNRSEIRQRYEREILEAILKVTVDKYGDFKIKESFSEYPGTQESLVFSEKNHHLFVTIAGNQKFSDEEKIVILKPIAKNLLGYRIPIIKSKDVEKFKKNIDNKKLKSYKLGIPETWSDAEIFRFNNYKVAEEGTFDDIFERLSEGKFDYVTFGANEVSSVFENRASKLKTLEIENDLLFFYPFPLVFYVNPRMPKLAERVALGLQKITDSGELDAVFNKYYANIVQNLQLDKRTLFVLENPLIPKEFANLQPNIAGL
ncbi:MAG: transporter substrate-binding domain-containing protein [Lutibacter sp.]|nr:transporter substrate-binding domain-containing protein [Lutibacter sp.]